MSLSTHRLRSAGTHRIAVVAFRIIVLLAVIAALAAALAGCASRKQADDTRPAVKNADPAPPTPSQVDSQPNQPGEQAKPPNTAPQPVDPAEAAGPLIAVDQQTITLRWIEKGELRMSATARESRLDERTRTGVLLDFSAKLYENGKLTSTMTAPKVVADSVSRVVTATGGVTMKSMERNTTVKCEWAKWYQKQQKVIGNGGVKVKSDTWDTDSAAFVADTGLRTLTLKNSAKGLVP